jgi:Fe-S-cluster containining protein
VNDWIAQRHIESFSYEKDKLIVTYSKPESGGTLSYTEEFVWGPDYPPLWLKEAASTFVDAITEAVQQRVALTQEVPCGRCTGACCRNWEGGIRVAHEDVERMQEAGIDPRECVELWDGAEWFTQGMHFVDEPVYYIADSAASIDGSIGMMKMVPWKGLTKEETACINLREDGCSIYEHRPEVCRQFSGFGCTMVEEDPRKKEGLIQLRVK